MANNFRCHKTFSSVSLRLFLALVFYSFFSKWTKKTHEFRAFRFDRHVVWRKTIVFFFHFSIFESSMPMWFNYELFWLLNFLKIVFFSLSTMKMKQKKEILVDRNRWFKNIFVSRMIRVSVYVYSERVRIASLIKHALKFHEQFNRMCARYFASSRKAMTATRNASLCAASEIRLRDECKLF